MKEEFDGIINGKNVKTIIKENKEGKRAWLAKSKQHDEPTPHFSERDSNLSVHEDSPDNSQFRVMSPLLSLGSVFFPKGETFICGIADAIVLPMAKENTNYKINTSLSGLSISLSQEGWVLFGVGNWSNWENKK